MEEVLSWLNDPHRTYERGVLLYQQYGSNRSLKDFFSRPVKDVGKMMSKLEYNMAKICGNARMDVVPADNLSKIETKTLTLPNEPTTDEQQDEERKNRGNNFNPAELPENLQPVYKQIQSYPAILAKMKEEQKNAQTDQDRMHWANELVRVEDEKIAAWKQIDDYLFSRTTEQNDHASDSEEDIVEKITKMTKRLEIIESSIARAQKEMDEFNFQGNEKMARKRAKTIDNYNNEKANIEQKLANLKK